jgi:hypothetical protein
MKILICATKYWVRVRRSVKEERVRHCFQWQVGQQRVDYWAQRLREEPDTIGLGYTRKNAGETEVRTTRPIIKTTFKGRGS